MFKSKTNFDAFDKHNTKVANIEAPKLKGLSKANLKKLASSPGEETPFHLILDYFQDKNGKPMGHFLDFGTHKKMAKHFEQVEMKPGKLDKSISGSPKEACVGTAHVKKVNGVGVLYFKPHEKSKIPMGKWAKIIKALKPLLGGMKAVVMLDGLVLEDSSETTENTEQSTEPSANSSVQALKKQWTHITAVLKGDLPKEILPRIKSNTAIAKDLETVQNLLSSGTIFQQKLKEAPQNIQQVFAKAAQLLTAQLPKVAAIKQHLEKMLNSTSTEEAVNDPNEQALQKQLEELIERAQSGLDAFEKNFQNYLRQPEQEPVSITGGEDFLATIF